jgi:hypothetical protein
MQGSHARCKASCQHTSHLRGCHVPESLDAPQPREMVLNHHPQRSRATRLLRSARHFAMARCMCPQVGVKQVYLVETGCEGGGPCAHVVSNFRGAHVSHAHAAGKYAC